MRSVTATGSGSRQTASASLKAPNAIAALRSAVPAGIRETAYDTAWIAGLFDPRDPSAPRYPQALRWLLENQHSDGSWGGAIPYEHDRLLSTLAALPAIAAFGQSEGTQAALRAGARYLWQRGHLLATEPVEPVGFELLLPMLIERARKAGVDVPPHLDIYHAQRKEKLRLIPAEALYSRFSTTVHSLEFLGCEADLERLVQAQGPNASVGNSPAATAFLLSLRENQEAAAYLEQCMSLQGGAGAPVLEPCETFDLLWAAYQLHLAGVPAESLLTPQEATWLLEELEASGGIGLSPSFPIPDADETSVAILLLEHLEQRADPRVLERFAKPDGYFASFPYERHSSLGVNLHVLHALLRVPGYPDAKKTVRGLLDFILDEQQHGLYWQDKWHISPYYATSHALAVLAEAPSALATRAGKAVSNAKDWVRQTQNEDGSWGFYAPTAEETAYGIMALIGRVNRAEEQDQARCEKGLRFLRYELANVGDDLGALMPPLWVDKCLYTPTLIVQAAIESAFIAYRLAYGDEADSDSQVTRGVNGNGSVPGNQTIRPGRRKSAT